MSAPAGQATVPRWVSIGLIPLINLTLALIVSGLVVLVIGENPRSEDMDVNICREKKQTNVRAAASDDTIRLTPPRVMTLERSLEFISDDECIEVTPNALRLRKTVFDATTRGRARKRLQYAAR